MTGQNIEFAKTEAILSTKIPPQRFWKLTILGQKQL